MYGGSKGWAACVDRHRGERRNPWSQTFAMSVLARHLFSKAANVFGLALVVWLCSSVVLRMFDVAAVITPTAGVRGRRQESPTKPRNGHTLVVGIGARISGCTNQKEVSLEDQVDHGKEVVADYYPDYKGPKDYRVVATKGKGERLDRPELAVIEAMIRSDELDVFVWEDLGRLVRGVEAARLCGIAVDHGTRILAPHDCIDTNEDSWEEDVIAACRDHVSNNAHVSKRLKHKLMNRFKKFGGVTPLPIFGYIKPPGAKTYDDWQKEPSAAPVYCEWLRLLKQTLNCSAVGDWLNENKVPTGPHSRRKIWDGKMVRRITRNPLLKGMPGRGFRHTIKHNETGRRISVKNPNGPHYREYPHLAFWEPAEFDEINALLENKNKGCGRKPVNGGDPRSGVSRRRTRFPGQYALCWYCGWHVVWGGNGVTQNLMCSNSRGWHCWNGIGFNGALATERIVGAITQELNCLDGFDDQFRELVRHAAREGGADQDQRWRKLERGEQEVAHQKENLLSAIASYGPRPMIEKKLAEVEAVERDLIKERHELERLRNRSLKLPQSVGKLRDMLEEQLTKLAMDSPEFGDLLRQLVPGFHVYLVRLCDGGHPLPRAKVRLALDGIVPDAKHVPGLEELLKRELTIDLFDRPPQRERIREMAVALTAEGKLTQRQIAREIMRRLPERKVTQPAVQNALALDRQMRELGLETPYVLLEEPPNDYFKLRRHLNPKYRFEPREGYQRPPI